MEEERRYKFSSLGRPIELKVVTNNAIIVIMVVVLLVGIIVQSVGGMPILKSLWWGAQAALTMFFAWAIGRELDPAHDLAAFVALPIAAAAYFWLGFPDWLLTAFLLFVFRIINKTVGLSLKIVDVAGVLLLGVWLFYQGNWLIAGLLPLPFLLDALLPERDWRQLISFVLAIAVIIAVSWFSIYQLPTPRLTMPLIISASALAVAAVPVLIFIHRPHVIADATEDKLHSMRIRATLMLAVLTCAAGNFFYGTFGIADLMTLWAAICGVYIYRFATIFIKNKK